MRVGTYFIDDEIIEKYNIPFKAITEELKSGQKQMEAFKEMEKKIIDSYNISDEEVIIIKRNCWYDIEEEIIGNYGSLKGY